MDKLKCCDTERIVSINTETETGSECTILSRAQRIKDAKNTIKKHLSKNSIAAINTASDMTGECHCEDQYTVEPHGDKFAVYFGRCPHRHGQRILSFMPDGSDVVTGETTTIDACQFKTPEVDIPEINIHNMPTFEAPKIPNVKFPEDQLLADIDAYKERVNIFAEGLKYKLPAIPSASRMRKMKDDLDKKNAEVTFLKKQLEEHKDAIHFYKEASRIRKEVAKDLLKTVRSMSNIEDGNSSKEESKREVEYYKELSRYYSTIYQNFINVHNKFMDKMSLITGVNLKKDAAKTHKLHAREQKFSGDLLRAFNGDFPYSNGDLPCSTSEGRSCSTSEWSSSGHGNDDEDVVNR